MEMVLGMLMLLKVYPKTNQQKVWDYVMENFTEPVSDNIVPIQMSQHIGDNVVGILFNVDNIDNMVDFLIEKIGTCEEIQDTQSTIFMKPVFLPLPKDRTKRLRRFTIPFKVKSQNYDEIYNRLIEYKYPKNLFPIYISYILGDCDILASIIGTDIETVHDFLAKEICPMGGICSYSITEFGRSQRLISQEKWRTLQRSMLYIPSWAAGKLKEKYLYDYDLSPPKDEFALSGAMVDEL
jgi:hypothetical protein